ncbi:hypothetical protein EDC96DRAFT_579531 [Choanephora cucurbitarum]|nr:hypothetical protein EDC96DRAFT_579531 [Choanephora cucurbitarum]
MLSQQVEAWAVHAAIFLFFTIILTLRCRNNVFLIPFALFGFLVTIGSILLAMYRKGYETASSNSMSIAEQQYWIKESLVLSFLPAASVLVFGGIMEAQLIYIRHIAAAIYNRDHWGSMYLRNAEKHMPAKKSAPSLRPWTYWTSLFLLVLYTLVAIASVLVETVIGVSDRQKDLSIAVCSTLLFVFSSFNIGLVWYTSAISIKHIRMIRQNRDDMLFLRITPILFSISMAGMTILTWIHFTVDTLPLVAWIVLESLLVYTPLVGVLVMCIYTGKIKKIGRQYGAEPAQRSFNSEPPRYTSNKVGADAETSSEDEKRTFAVPPPAYKPSLSHHYH